MMAKANPINRLFAVGKTLFGLVLLFCVLAVGPYLIYRFIGHPGDAVAEFLSAADNSIRSTNDRVTLIGAGLANLALWLLWFSIARSVLEELFLAVRATRSQSRASSGSTSPGQERWNRTSTPPLSLSLIHI